MVLAFGYSTCRSDEIRKSASIAQTTQNLALSDENSFWIVVNMFTGRTSRQAVKVSGNPEASWRWGLWNSAAIRGHYC